MCGSVCLSVCLTVYTPILFGVIRRTTAKLGDGVGSGRGRPSSNASATRCREGVIQGQTGSNPYSLSYGGETWVVERCSDVDNFEGQFVIRGQPKVNPYSLSYGSET